VRISYGVEAEVVDDQQVDCDEAPELGLVAVIEARVLEEPEELVGPEQDHRDTSSSRNVPERVRDEVLSDVHGSYDREVDLEKSKRRELVPHLAVVGHLRRRVSRLEGHVRIEAGALRSEGR
jgi:hypothetical protein